MLRPRPMGVAPACNLRNLDEVLEFKLERRERRERRYQEKLLQGVPGPKSRRPGQARSLDQRAVPRHGHV